MCFFTAISIFLAFFWQLFMINGVTSQNHQNIIYLNFFRHWVFIFILVKLLHVMKTPSLAKSFPHWRNSNRKVEEMGLRGKKEMNYSWHQKTILSSSFIFISQKWITYCGVIFFGQEHKISCLTLCMRGDGTAFMVSTRSIDRLCLPCIKLKNGFRAPGWGFEMSILHIPIL